MSDETRRRYQTEPMLPVTPGFQRQLAEWMAAEWGRKSDLARRLGIDHSALSALTKTGRVKNSVLVAPICRELGWVVPVADGDPELHAALALIKTADPGLYAKVTRLVLSAAVSLPSSPPKPEPPRPRKTPRPSR